MHENISQDEYGEVLNSERTFEGLGELIEKHGSVVIGWTDQQGSHLDILFTLMPIQAGNLQRGMSALTDIFVSISHFGMHGFKIDDVDLDAGYVAEKLRLDGVNVTSTAVAELINGVKKELV